MSDYPLRKTTGLEHGHCLCGAIQFTVEGEPIYNVVCHCENCRRQGGSILHCASIYEKKRYTLTKGHDSLSTYSDTATQSSHPLLRDFCKNCGSNVSARTTLAESIISVPAGILNTVGSDWIPHKEQFVRDRAKWIPQFECVLSDQMYVCGPTGETVRSLAESKF